MTDWLYFPHCFFLWQFTGKLVSLRDLEKECKYDVRFQMLLNGERPSYKTFERFINENLCLGIEELLKKLNLYIMDHTHIDRDILYIDGTKYEAYANKMTFDWKKATDKFYARNWAKAIKRDSRIKYILQ